MKRIGVLTSGGDSPGMNAAIRAIIRSGISKGIEVFGVYEGYYGLHNNYIKNLSLSDSSGLINKGGTFLGSSRYPEFKKENIRKQAIQNLKMHAIEALIIIGGDGSYAGAAALTEMGLPCVGLPGTIDNDIAGTDYTIGFMTALNTILDAIDKLRDTSASHQRISIIEVMGRNCADLAMMSTIAGGCDYMITPEKLFKKEELISQLKNTIFQGKKHAIVVITEKMTNVMELAKYVEEQTGKQTRSTILGHTQRGGNPTGFDRMLSARMGNHAVQLCLNGVMGVTVGWQNSKLVTHAFSSVVNCNKKEIRKDLLTLAENLY